MTHADLVTLLDFHYWARDRMLDAVGRLAPPQYVRDLRGSFGSVRDTAAHIYSADWVWFSRWRGHSPTSALDFADYPDVPTLARAWRELEQQVRAFVQDLGDSGADRVFEYKLLSGKPGKSAFWQMLQHVVNHGTYHRGQITTMLRQLGTEPPKSTDLITFHRERAG
ncbi:MAG TPA: DinB family protein [Vicinamibacterales bacterium]|nr:DinB family protein [Vicinamibacterales bacterium]